MKKILISLKLMIMTIFSCSSDKQSSFPSQDLSQLLHYINMEQVKPISVLWVKSGVGNEKKRGVPGPNDYNLISVIKLNESDFNSVLSKYEGKNDIRNKIYLEKDFVKEWFPNDVKQKFYIEGNYCRISETVYNASSFFRSPLINGICFFTKENNIFVMLYTV